jgi:hypothetical protein
MYAHPFQPARLKSRKSFLNWQVNWKLNLKLDDLTCGKIKWPVPHRKSRRKDPPVFSYPSLHGKPLTVLEREPPGARRRSWSGVSAQTISVTVDDTKLRTFINMPQSEG